MIPQVRNTFIGCLFLNTVSLSGILQLGDSARVSLTSKAIAVQKAIPTFEDDEFRFAQFSIFFLPKLTLHPCVTASLQMDSPLPADIHIRSIRALAVSSASLFRVGCGGPLQAESRIMHIRNYNNNNKNRDIS